MMIHTQIDRQIDIQIDRQADGWTDRQTETDKWTDSQIKQGGKRESIGRLTRAHNGPLKTRKAGGSGQPPHVYEGKVKGKSEMKQNKPRQIFYFSSDIKKFLKRTQSSKIDREILTDRLRKDPFLTTFYCNKKVMTLKIKAGLSYSNTH